MDFSDKDIFETLESASAAVLDELAFGVVRMNADFEVVEYNAYESNLSGLSREQVTGRNFFESIAPCTNNFMVSHRFSVEAELDDTIDYLFTFRLSPTRVRLRLLKSANHANCYVLVELS